MRSFANAHALAAAMILLPAALLAADVDTKFHNAPASAQAAKNPYAGQEETAQAGKTLYTRDCLSCHGKLGHGTSNVPSLVDGKLDSVTPGEVFWFITRGDKENGMPAWASLPAKQRWQIVTYLESLGTSQVGQEASAPPPLDMNTSKLKAPPPTPPFTDFRYEKPGTLHKITVSDLPQPYATKSRFNSPDLVARGRKTCGRRRRPDSRWSCMRLGSTIPGPCARLRTVTFFLQKAIPDASGCFAG